MSKLIVLLIALAVAWAGWQVGGMLSTDAVAMLLGFGLCFVFVFAPLCVLTLYGRKTATQVYSHADEQKTLQQPAIAATGLITHVPAQTWRVLDPSTSLAVRENEVIVYGN